VRSPCCWAAPARPSATVVLPTPALQAQRGDDLHGVDLPGRGEHYCAAVELGTAGERQRRAAPVRCGGAPRRRSRAPGAAVGGRGPARRHPSAPRGCWTWGAGAGPGRCRWPGWVARDGGRQQPQRLAALHRRAREAGVAPLVDAVQGDVDALADVAPAGCADLVLGPRPARGRRRRGGRGGRLARAAAPGSVVSVLVAGRYAAVLARTSAVASRGRAVLTDPHGPLRARRRPAPAPRRRRPAGAAGGCGLRVELLQGDGVLDAWVPARPRRRSRRRAVGRGAGGAGRGGGAAAGGRRPVARLARLPERVRGGGTASPARTRRPRRPARGAIRPMITRTGTATGRLRRIGGVGGGAGRLLRHTMRPLDESGWSRRLSTRILPGRRPSQGARRVAPAPWKMTRQDDQCRR
jgi:hypothetical protein